MCVWGWVGVCEKVCVCSVCMCMRLCDEESVVRVCKRACVCVCVVGEKERERMLDQETEADTEKVY